MIFYPVNYPFQSYNAAKRLPGNTPRVRETVPLLVLPGRLADRVVRAEPYSRRQPLLHVQRVVERACGLSARPLQEAGPHYAAAMEAANHI